MMTGAQHRFAERLEDTLRKIGTLFVAFAPLDGLLNRSAKPWGHVLLFFLLGLSFIIISVITAYWREK
jgi:hypothetical protein